MHISETRATVNNIYVQNKMHQLLFPLNKSIINVDFRCAARHHLSKSHIPRSSLLVKPVNAQPK